jgi:hypothetical protein
MSIKKDDLTYQITIDAEITCLARELDEKLLELMAAAKEIGFIVNEVKSEEIRL